MSESACLVILPAVRLTALVLEAVWHALSPLIRRHREPSRPS